VVGAVLGARSVVHGVNVHSLLTTPRPTWLLIAVAVAALALLSRAVSWMAVLRAAMPNEEIPRGAVVRATMIGVMLSAALPGRLGEPARAWLVARRTPDTRGSLSVVLGTLISQTLLNIVALAALATLAFASLVGLRTGPLVIVAIVPVAVALVATAAPQIAGFVARHGPRRIRRIAAGVATQASALRRGLEVFRRPRLAVPAAGAQMLAWALQTLCCYALLRALRLDDAAAVGSAAAVLFAVNVTAVVPVTPSNVGVFQAACIAVLSAFHVSQAHGLEYGIALQAVEVVTALALGLIALTFEGLSFAELRRGARAARRAADPTP
jgi:phosphatidyl-myo-inositol alpha-mannosyltransferase